MPKQHKKEKTMTSFSENKARVLVEMLTRMRPAGSKTERRFIREYIRPLGVTQDKAGNLIKRIGSAPVLWSSHTDTVHKVGGNQLVEVSQGVARLAAKSTSNCLGADCTTGVWLMREMILADVPGLYIFHRGEEVGGTGSQYIAHNTPELLAGIQYAIAFDRRGYEDIITHQGSRCCSDEFAWSLADALDMHGLAYAPDQTGTFTDTANYVDLIPECTNIGVGYSCAHMASEHQDLNFALLLRDALCDLDLGRLEVHRKPGEGGDDYGDWYSTSNDNTRDPWDPRTGFDDKRTMMELVRDHPDIVADLLCEFGYDVQGLRGEVWTRGGMIQ
jgi:hypothetical protein